MAFQATKGSRRRWWLRGGCMARGPAPALLALAIGGVVLLAGCSRSGVAPLGPDMTGTETATPKDRLLSDSTLVEARTVSGSAPGEASEERLLWSDALGLYLLHSGGQSGDTSGRKKGAGTVVDRLVVANQVIVGLREDVTESELRAIAKREGYQMVRRIVPYAPLYLVRLNEGQPTFDTLHDGQATLSRETKVVAYAESDPIVFDLGATSPPNDPYYASQWGLENKDPVAYGPLDVDIDAEGAWTITTGSPNVIVAINDSGIAYSHPDLAPNIWVNPGESGIDPITGQPRAANGVDDDNNGYVDDHRGWNFIDDNNDVWDYDAHGTRVAGIVGAVGDNGIGIAGVAWQVSLMAVKSSSGGSGPWSARLAAHGYAVANGAKIVQSSYGAAGWEFGSLRAAIEGGDVLTVAAAGNDDSNGNYGLITPPGTVATFVPAGASYGQILSVGATTYSPTETKASFSNYSDDSSDAGQWVDLFAPGDYIRSTIPAGPPDVQVGAYNFQYGTSFAAPLVSGVAALLFAQAPTATWQEVKARILGSVDPVSTLQGLCLTGGRLNAANAVCYGQSCGAAAAYDFETSDIGHDSSANGHDGVAEGIGAVAGIHGQAADFAGDDSDGYDRLVVTDKAGLGFTDALTVSAWINPRRTDQFRPLVNQWYRGDSYVLGIDDGQFFFRLALTDGYWATVTATPPSALLGKWTHVAGLFDGTQAQLYIDGVLAASVATNPGAALRVSQQPLIIGHYTSRTWVDPTSLPPEPTEQPSSGTPPPPSGQPEPGEPPSTSPPPASGQPEPGEPTEPPSAPQPPTPPSYLTDEPPEALEFVPFDGLIDDVKIFNKALSASEVANM